MQPFSTNTSHNTAPFMGTPRCGQPLNMMIVDDTITYRAILKETMSGVEGVHIVATARHGQDALEKLTDISKQGQTVDLVLLDVEMPVMDGMTTLKEIKQRYPKTAVVMVSGVSATSANLTFRALEAGALDFVAKPTEGNAHGNISALREKLLPIIAHLSQRRQDGRAVNQTPSASSCTSRPAAPSVVKASKLSALPKATFHPKVLAIGISTGGPNALKSLLPQLPATLNVPVVVVIHMPEKFTAYLADSLNRLCALTVKEAQANEPLKPNTVYIAPGGFHMEVATTATEGEHIRLHQQPPENNCRPAVDVLFRSLAQVYGQGVLNVIMTGMGADGLAGVRALKAHNGHYTLTQSQSSCVIYGMPKAIDDAGLSDEQVALDELGNRIVMLCTKR